ncbi:MAG: hypothetical protein ACKVWR_19515, partial [Acidimicrobiales bacterium]
MASYPTPGEKIGHYKSPLSWVDLPACGRRGPIPLLPRDREWSTWTMDRWAKLWRRPEAVMWADDPVSPDVERWALLTDLIWGTDHPAAGWLQEVRQIEDRLGVSPKARLQLRWRVVDDE